MKKVSKPLSPIPEDMSILTVEGLKGAMPKRQKKNITQPLVDKLNKLVTDPEEREYFREHLVSYSHVLQDPHVKLDSYIFAVKYVSYKLMGLTNQNAWIKTFPDRYKRLMDLGKSADHLRATVSCYHANKIVATVMEQALIPTHILNADVFQQAVNQQAHLMLTAKSDKVRSDAANSLMTHLKQPETAKLKVEIGVKDDDSLRVMRTAITDLAIAQKEAIQVGASDAEQIANAKLIEGEAERIDA